MYQLLLPAYARFYGREGTCEAGHKDIGSQRQLEEWGEREEDVPTENAGSYEKEYRKCNHV